MTYVSLFFISTLYILVMETCRPTSVSSCSGQAEGGDIHSEDDGNLMPFIRHFDRSATSRCTSPPGVPRTYIQANLNNFQHGDRLPNAWNNSYRHDQRFTRIKIFMQIIFLVVNRKSSIG